MHPAAAAEVVTAIAEAAARTAVALRRQLLARALPMVSRYSARAGQKVKRAMHERKQGTLKSGGSGKTVKSRKQAIAIGLSEARKEGKKVPSKKSAKKSRKTKKTKKTKRSKS